jgi:hypothetical protein
MIPSGVITLKIKYLIIAFSIIFVIIILVTALAPLMITSQAEPEFAVNFQYITLPLIIFMVLLLGGLGIFFFFNYRLLSLLEREDWPALAYYLEQKIYTKGRFSQRYVRLLASSYLVITDYQSVLKLENKTMLAKPSIVSKNVLLFGTARVLSGNHKEAAVFFKSSMEKDKGKHNARDEQWIRWFYGFSHLLSGAFNQAEPDFTVLAISSPDALITGLSSYFLSNSITKHSQNPEECRAAAESGRIRVVNVMKNKVGWKKEVDKMSSDIHIAIIRKYIDEAGNWLFP